jgi:hypothetical protein
MQHLRQPKLLQFLLQPARQPGIHAAPSTQHDGFVQTTPHIHICRLDGIEQELRDARLLDVDKMRLEQTFGRLEPLATDSDDAAIR